MRRAPCVIAGTAAGLALVLSFHTSGASLVSLSTGPAASRSTPTTSAPSTTSAPATTTTRPPTTSTTSGSRSAGGQTVYYQYGVLQLRVTVTGARITAITPVVDEASDRRSADINDQAIPQLRDQALQAQAANIDGVSGATYTSQAYVQSLQSALDQLGWKG